MKNWALEAYLGSFNGVSLLLKKDAELNPASFKYTPLVEVNQALFAWSFRQLGYGQGTY